MAFCTECGANVPDGLKFCTGCGKLMDEATVSQTQQQPQQQQQVQQQQPQQQQVQQSASVARVAPATATPATLTTQPIATVAYNPAANMAPPKGSRYAVMGTLGYIGTMILFAIPLIGIIVCIIWSFSSTVNINRRNLSRAFLIFMIIAVVLGIISFIFMSTLLGSLWDHLLELIDGQIGGFSDMLGGLDGLPTY